MSGTDIRWCDQGCGYKLPPEYAPDETTCGACLDNPIGCCEMATDTWACGNSDALTRTHVHTRGRDDEWTEYRYVCSSCRTEYGTEVTA